MKGKTDIHDGTFSNTGNHIMTDPYFRQCPDNSRLPRSLDSHKIKPAQYSLT
jgi:hypothetical protein